MLKIRTFGGFHVSCDKQASLVIGRSAKMWELLKCLLAYYPNPVTTDKLVEAVWPDGSVNDPVKNIKDIVYRLLGLFIRKAA